MKALFILLNLDITFQGAGAAPAQTNMKTEAARFPVSCEKKTKSGMLLTC